MLQLGQPNPSACDVVIGSPRDLPGRAFSRTVSGGGRVDVRHAQARFLRPAYSVPPRHPFLAGLFLLCGSFLKSLHDVLTDDHPGASWWAGTVVESTLTRDKSVLPWRVTRRSGLPVAR
jgi:hypothetical protein